MYLFKAGLSWKFFSVSQTKNAFFFNNLISHINSIAGFNKPSLYGGSRKINLYNHITGASSS